MNVNIKFLFSLFYAFPQSPSGTVHKFYYTENLLCDIIKNTPSEV